MTSRPEPVELIRPSQLANRAPYAYAAVAHQVSRLVFTAGACPLDEHGATVSPGDVAGQAEQVMANFRIALHAAGPDLLDVVETTVYVAGSDRRATSTLVEGRTRVPNGTSFGGRNEARLWQMSPSLSGQR